jgi:DNA repair protein RecO (recombination protein O)
MVEQTTGLVLRTRRLTESSLIVSWLTANAGRISTVAKGVLRPKSPYRGKVDLFYLAEFTFTRSRRSELHTLCEIRLVETHPALRQELAALRAASYGAAFVEQTTETDTPLPGMLENFLGFLQSLGEMANSPGSNAQKIFAFELRMLEALGLEPDFGANHISAPTIEVIHQLQDSEWGEVGKMHVPTAQAVELRRFLHGFLVYNFGRLARGRDAAVAGTV